MLQKAGGDPSDILQMVRWQEFLYRTRPVLRRLECAERVVSQSREFVQTFGRGKENAYPALLRGLGACFRETAGALEKERQGLTTAAAAMDRPDLSLAGLEKAHRAFLLALQDAAGTGVN